MDVLDGQTTVSDAWTGFSITFRQTEWLKPKQWPVGSTVNTDTPATGVSRMSLCLRQVPMSRRSPGNSSISLQPPGIASAYGFRLISIHGDHVRTAHTCTCASDSARRCSWLRNSVAWREFRRSRLRRRNFVADCTVDDWSRVVGYYAADGRQRVHIDFGGEDGRSSIRVEGLQVRTLFFVF